MSRILTCRNYGMLNRCLKLLSLCNLLHSREDRGTSPSHSSLALWASTTLVSLWNHHAPLTGCHTTSRLKFHVPVLLSICHSPYLLKAYTFFMLKPNHLLLSILLNGHCNLLPHSLQNRPGHFLLPTLVYKLHQGRKVHCFLLT